MSRAQAPIALDDLPRLWMQDLCLASDQPGAWFMACRRLRDVVLSLYSTPLTYTLGCRYPLGQPEASPAQASGLTLATQSSHPLKLTLKQADHPVYWYRALEHLLITAGAPLNTIHEVVLEGVDLICLVPACLILACPNLHKLTLVHTRVNVGPGCPIPPARQITHLTFIGVTLSGSTLQQLHSHLHALPNLKDLSVQPPLRLQGWQLAHVSNSWISAVQTVASQLTSLDFPAFPDPGMFTPNVFLVGFPQLTRLHLDIYVDDVMLELLLLSGPQLSVLHVFAFSLQDSHQDKTCRWQQLAVEYLTLGSLLQLPQANLTKLTAAAQNLNVTVERTDGPFVSVDEIHQVVARVAACGGLHFGDLHQLHLYVATAEQLTAIMPLLAAVPPTLFLVRLVLYSPVDDEVLAAVSTLSMMTAGPAFVLELEAPLLTHMASQLWCRLPRVTMLRVLRTPEPPLITQDVYDQAFACKQAVLLTLVLSATRPVTLDVSSLGLDGAHELSLTAAAIDNGLVCLCLR